MAGFLYCLGALGAVMALFAAGWVFIPSSSRTVFVEIECLIMGSVGILIIAVSWGLAAVIGELKKRSTESSWHSAPRETGPLPADVLLPPANAYQRRTAPTDEKEATDARGRKSLVKGQWSD